ncbi:magnesium transporter MgtE [Amylibacter ulvae]|uniref:Magnesium transporter MgtE n=1 Tax=Paramylibacter ulvae TaxID=1651968 RepID=A0ABQ3D7K0_9RHOB|nr:magnesium transporter [Amylibacter ulvae]GHA54748.1 magnesium transporter MgtE [Amylibacter ulvae]
MTDTSSIEHAQTDRAYEIDSGFINAVLSAVEDGARDDLIALFEPLHAADIADVLEQVSPAEREAVVALWGDEVDGEVFAEMDEDISVELMENLSDDIIGEAMRDLDTDDVVDLIEDMDEPQKERVLETLEEADRAAVQQSLSYPEESAGRLMQRELVMAPTHWLVGDAIDEMRKSDDLPERFYDVVIVDPRLKPVGKVPLSSLMSHPRDTPLTEIMDEEFRTIPVSQSQEDVAYAFNQYNMVSAPVVDAQDRLVGVITMDDAMEVLEEEAEEDIMLLAGVGDETLHDSTWNTTKLRFPWLAVNLVTSILASLVIAQFSSTIEAIVALAILMPIVASMGGNAGTQTLTVAVRALATKDLTPSNAWRVIRREMFVGLLNGCIFAVIIGIVGVAWFGTPMLGVVLGLAMVVNLLVAGLAGIMVPIVLDKMGVDPALASSAFVTTVTDVVGFFVFLGLAGALLL